MAEQVATVVHLLPRDLARGAQAYARVLRDHLDGAPHRHRILTLFEGPEAGLQPDRALGRRRGRLARAGLDPMALLALRCALAGEHADVVVAHGGEPLKYAALAGVSPLVYLRIGIGSARAQRWPWRRFQRWLVGRADAIAAVSEDAAKDVLAGGGARVRPFVIPNGRDHERFHPRAGVLSEDGTVTLAFVGHLTWTKRPEHFIEVVRSLRESGVVVRAWMAGDGPSVVNVRRLADDAGVEVLGRREDVAELLRSADLLLFTSQPEGEGMPGVLIEAGLSGLPVVATDVPGVRDVVVDGVTGLVVDVDDIEGLADGARQLITDRRLRQRMGAAARTRCVERFSLEVTLERWRELLDPLLETDGAPTDVAPRSAAPTDVGR